jgi:hypothetical protein
MSENVQPAPARRPRLALVAIGITATACLAAIVLRTPIRARYWAWQISNSVSATQRSGYLASLCNAGAQGRWGIAALLADSDAEVRQYGVLALHHVRTAWARQRLTECVTDRDPSVQRLAAVGLAIHGDDSVIPVLKRFYESGDVNAATGACLALERLGTPDAIATLDELTLQPAEVNQRAALVDALAGLSKPACVPPLLRLLSDQRTCNVPPRSAEIALRALDALQASGHAAQAASAPVAQAFSQTIAQRAADALGVITGIQASDSSGSAEADRGSAKIAWQRWFENHRPSQ